MQTGERIPLGTSIFLPFIRFNFKRKKKKVTLSKKLILMDTGKENELGRDGRVLKNHVDEIDFLGIFVISIRTSYIKVVKLCSLKRS